MKSLRPLVLGGLVLAASATPAFSQMRPLEHPDVLHWNSIANPSLSPDGGWLAWVQRPLEGDPTLRVRTAREGGVDLSVRGTSPVFTSDSRFVVFEVPPLEAVLDSLKLEGKKRDDLPGDSLAVADLTAVFAGGAPQPSGVTRLGAVEDFKVAEEGSWLAYRVKKEKKEEEPAAERAETPAAEAPAAEGAESRPDHKKDEGSTLVVRNLVSGAESRYEDAVEYVFSKNGRTLAFTTSTKDGSHDGAFVLTLSDGGVHTLRADEGHYRKIALSEDGTQVAFLTDAADFAAKQPEFTLERASAGSWTAKTLASTSTAGIPEDWWVSENGTLRFSEKGTRLYFGTAPRPAPDPEEKVLDEDKVSVDVWNWKDPYLQPMQLVQADEEKKRSYDAVVHLDAGRVVQLGTPEIPDVRFADEGEPRFALGVTDVPYRQLLSWDGRYSDVYAIDLTTGVARKVAEQVKGFGGGSISPAGTWASWWDGAERQWKGAPLAGGATVTLSAGAGEPVWYELDDHPDEPPPYGSAGWTAGDVAFLYYDSYDVFRFEPASGTTTNLTRGQGRESGLRFRYADTEPELEHVPEGEILLSAFHLTNKQGGFYQARSDRAGAPRQILLTDKSFALRGKAKDADRWLVSREDFREFPDLWVTDGPITDMVKLTDANPQQRQFTWGTAELTEWTSNDGAPLQGMLFKPDGFDPSQKYPMMVYFYERMSDGLYEYRSPVPGSSSIAVPFYVSRGYLVFIPDIPYEIGYPGESALDAVVPGVLSLTAKGFVQEDKIGVQGHSWGGYQIAYMVTRTNLFAAAEAGAPVANMTSAYGGIRWQTGMSRAFQYERTQSRIGGTPWDATDEYLSNSPLFFVNKIETPLLMMHNDADGAVPWYQGIEMFSAMRRLQKPVWMLNYNGEAHGLREERNRKDWALRMQQFFDHYLKDAPAPVWMEEGVPAIMKGKTLGTEIRIRGVS
ncbi:MAG: prolyl oligopeptidase family serine peptidase [Gemmatimonadota bacterium]